MGYSYYYLDQEGRALPCFEKALEARPDDEDTKELIDWCKKRIALPQFSECFRERTDTAWEDFSQQKAQLRRVMDENNERGTELAYFQKHAPKEALEHWNILVGRQPVRNIGLRTEDGWEITGEDVQIWLEEQGENSFTISAYCEKLLPMLQEEEGRAWWMLTTFTDQVLGEIPHMRYIDSFDVLEQPKAILPCQSKPSYYSSIRIIPRCPSGAGGAIKTSENLFYQEISKVADPLSVLYIFAALFSTVLS